jgi:hypothetical protein
MEKMRFRRAFLDDPKTFRRYVPIAEGMLSLTDRCGA